MNIQTILDKLTDDLTHYTKVVNTIPAYQGIQEFDKVWNGVKDSLTSMLDEIIEYGPQRMEHEEGETEEMKNIVSEHNGCVYDFHKIINSHR